MDKIVGRNIRIYRLAKGLSQTDLANKLGITFQQIQKYEKGTNRVGSGRLFEISTILGVSVIALFEGSKAVMTKHDEASPMNLLADPLSFSATYFKGENRSVRQCGRARLSYRVG